MEMLGMNWMVCKWWRGTKSPQLAEGKIAPTQQKVIKLSLEGLFCFVLLCLAIEVQGVKMVHEVSGGSEQMSCFVYTIVKEDLFLSQLYHEGVNGRVRRWTEQI